MSVLAVDVEQWRCHECAFEARSHAGLARHRSQQHDINGRWARRPRRPTPPPKHGPVVTLEEARQERVDRAALAYRAAWQAERRRLRDQTIRADIRARVAKIRSRVLGQ